MTWKAISEKLKADYGIDLTLQAVRTFFKKASQRKEMPLGFEQTQPSPVQPAKTPEVHAKKEEGTAHPTSPDPDKFFAERQRAIEKAKAESEKLKPYEEENE
jgi:antitoxin component of RelBE/YafQ-DinJ toxin-antitoxin module